MEFSPYEVNLPTHGIGMPPQMVGSPWSAGILARKCPELPLHFIQGMCGCAFSILLKPYLQTGGEASEELLEVIGKCLLSYSVSCYLINWRTFVHA